MQNNMDTRIFDQIVLNWKREAKFLLYNSTAMDRAAGRVYHLCAEELDALIKNLCAKTKVYATLGDKHDYYIKFYATQDAAIRDRMDWLHEDSFYKRHSEDDLRACAEDYVEEIKVLENY